MSKELETLKQIEHDYEFLGQSVNNSLMKNMSINGLQYIDTIKQALEQKDQQAKELELHRKLFKQLDLTLDIDGYDGNGISKSYEFFEINSEDGSYISNEDTIKIIKELKKLVGKNDE